MSDTIKPDDSRRKRLDEVIGAFLVAIDAGQSPDPREWLALHPDQEPELAEFFAGRERVDDLIEPMGPAHAHRVADPNALKAVDQTALPGSQPQMSLTGTERATEETQGHNKNGGSDPLRAGTRVRYFGDYELQKVLGEGGMGIVYKARQISLNRAVALKMIKATRFASAGDLRRFQNEAEAVARLDHSSIVPIFEVGQFDDQHYFSMKLIAGEGLDKRLKEFITDPRTAARLVAAAAVAIHHAHQRGILHRDLKPANVLVDADGQPHVTDFGLAKRVEGDSELTQSGAILGTPAYMAPEQASARKGAVTTATDIYGLGAILYALLTGRAPFTGATVLETLEQVRDRAPEPPRSVNRQIPRDLEVICLKCLEKDPRRRYASADGLAEDLKHWLSGEPIAARPISSAARFWMWCRRNPVIAAAAGLLTVALVLVAVLSLLYADRQARLARAERLRFDEQIQHSQQLKASFAGSSRRLAMLFFERAERSFEADQVGVGMLWMVESLRAATDAEDSLWKNLALTNLSAWQQHQTRLKGVFDFDDAYVTHVALSPDGRTVYTASNRSIAQLWDAITGVPIGGPMNNLAVVRVVVFSPDSKTILTTNMAGAAQLWNARTGLAIGTLTLRQSYYFGAVDYRGPVTAVAFSPDGKTILTGSDDWSARLWDAATGQSIGSAMFHGGPAFHDPVRSVAFSPDGKNVLTGSADKARLWDAATGLPVGTVMELEGAVVSVAFSPDGHTILTSTEKKASLWDRVTGERIGKPMEHDGRVTTAAFSADGKTVITGTADASTFGSLDGSVWLWDAATSQLLAKPLENRGGVDRAAPGPDGKTILVRSSDGMARLWNCVSNQPTGKAIEHPDRVYAMAFSPDGKTILSGEYQERTARLWNATTGQSIGQPMLHEGDVRSVAFSPDGKTVLTGSYDKTARLWDAVTGLPAGQAMEHQGEVYALAFSPDGKSVVTGSADRKATLWNAVTGQPIGKPMEHQGDVTSVAFSPSGKSILTGCDDKMARLWDVATHELIGKPIEHLREVGAVAFSPEGRIFLTGSADGTARLWDAATRAPIGRVMVHHAQVEAVAFSPDGKLLLTASADRTAQLWDKTGQPVGAPLREGGLPGRLFSSAAISTNRVGARLPDGWPKMAVAFSPDGKTVVVGGGYATTRIWEIPAKLPDDLPRLAAWVESMTGLTLDEQGAVHALSSTAWRQRRDMLAQLGGPPPVAAERLLDPILFGPDPIARARALITRKQWAEAEAAFAEAVRSRPGNAAIPAARGRFYLTRSEPAKAAADFVQALRLGNQDPSLLTELAASDQMFDRGLKMLQADATAISIELLVRRADRLARKGRLDDARSILVRLGTEKWEEAEPSRGFFPQPGTMFATLGCSAQVSALLAKHHQTTDPNIANNVAWNCALTPDAVPDPEIPLRLAELAVRGFPAEQKHLALNTLGASLYRAGRFQDAIRRLEEGVRLRNGKEEPADWPFLAMAHHRLGHREAARRSLDRLRNHEPSGDPNEFWDELEIRLLRSEAQAVILYDPVFPTNPFRR